MHMKSPAEPTDQHLRDTKEKIRPLDARHLRGFADTPHFVTTISGLPAVHRPRQLAEGTVNRHTGGASPRCEQGQDRTLSLHVLSNPPWPFEQEPLALSIPTSGGHPRSPFLCMVYPPLCGGTASKGTDLAGAAAPYQIRSQVRSLLIPGASLLVRRNVSQARGIV